MICSLVSLLLSVHFIFAATTAASEGFDLPRPQSEKSLAGHVWALLDTEGKLDIATVSSPEFADQFAPVTGSSVDFGYTKAAIWLRFSVTNTSLSETEWRLHFRENFLQELDVYQIPAEGAAVLLQSHQPNSPFSARTIAYPELVVGFELPPQQINIFYIRYKSGGSSQLAFTFRSRAEFDRLAATKTAKNFIYYGMLLFLILASLAAFAVTKRSIFAAYGAYVAFGLLFIMHGDGNAFHYLWPDMPGFNSFASVILGSGIIIFGASFSRLFLATKLYHPILNKLLWALIFGTLAMDLSTSVFDTQIIKKYLILLALFSMILFTISGLVAARTRFKQVRFYVIGWAGAALSAGIMTSRHWFGIEIPEEVQFDSMRIAIVFDAAMMGLAILDRINQLRRAQKQALVDNLAEAKRNLRLSGRLQTLENQYLLARKLAQSKDQKLADTVHDIRQPLHALRLNMKHLLAGKAAETAPATQIEEMFDYLENLVASELETSRDMIAVETPEASQGIEQVALAEVFESIFEMFAADAQQKGISLNYVNTSLTTDLPALDMMRITSNLVSNAIKYTDQGRVLFGMRQRKGQPWFEVHDTGIGLDSQIFEGKQTPQTSGDSFGLGLAIVREIAQKHGLEMQLFARPNGGSSIRVRLSRTKLG